MSEKEYLGKKQKRRMNILEILASNPLSSVMQLAKDLNVSTETIRQDLKSDYLKDKVVQAHGSVALAETTSGKDVPFSFRQEFNSKAKQKIAEEACKFILPGHVIVIEHSTMAFMIIQILSQNIELINSITIITNSFSIVNYIFDQKIKTQIIFLGGIFSNFQNNTYGSTTINQMNELHGDISFLSPAAINDQLLITAYEEKDVSLQKSIIANCKKNVLLLEKKKNSKVAMRSVNYAYDYDYIITDGVFSDEQREMASNSNTEIIFVET